MCVEATHRKEKMRVEATHRKEGDLGPGSPRTGRNLRKQRQWPANSGEELLRTERQSLDVVIGKQWGTDRGSSSGSYRVEVRANRRGERSFNV